MRGLVSRHRGRDPQAAGSFIAPEAFLFSETVI
jgi:hypothetical protein